MVTHDCPDNVDIPGLHGQFPDHELYRADVHRRALGRVVDEIQPYMLFHGHYHVSYSARRARSDGGDTLIRGVADDMSPLKDNFAILDLG